MRQNFDTVSQSNKADKQGDVLILTALNTY